MTQSAMYRVKFGLLGEWWCADASASEDECLVEFYKASIAPVSNPDLIRDRMFGGFHCQEDSRRRHVYHSVGSYTYINPEENVPLSEEERASKWKELIEANGEPGNGPFTAAGPTS